MPFLIEIVTFTVMVQQITKGIKVSVETNYDGVIERNSFTHHVFSYFISIENKSNETVQLTDRFWIIYDTLNTTEIVEGEGVVGQTPVLAPGDNYTYKSNCMLASTMGAMRGFFKMKNTVTFKNFKVAIPTFQLTTKPLSN